jgi:hypothetical protein
VHVSENAAIAESEIRIWFSEKELHEYTRADEGSQYG